jgi:hypothetical protein
LVWSRAKVLASEGRRLNITDTTFVIRMCRRNVDRSVSRGVGLQRARAGRGPEALHLEPICKTLNPGGTLVAAHTIRCRGVEWGRSFSPRRSLMYAAPCGEGAPFGRSSRARATTKALADHCTACGRKRSGHSGGCTSSALTPAVMRKRSGHSGGCTSNALTPAVMRKRSGHSGGCTSSALTPAVMHKRSGHSGGCTYSALTPAAMHKRSGHSGGCTSSALARAIMHKRSGHSGGCTSSVLTPATMRKRSGHSGGCTSSALMPATMRKRSGHSGGCTSSALTPATMRKRSGHTGGSVAFMENQATGIPSPFVGVWLDLCRPIVCPCKCLDHLTTGVVSL